MQNVSLSWGKCGSLGPGDWILIRRFMDAIKFLFLNQVLNVNGIQDKSLHVWFTGVNGKTGLDMLSYVGI